MLGWFASDYFQQSPVLVYPIIALGVFMTVFVGAVVRTLRARKSDIERMARLPLEADDE
jgi:hypothetical protein